MESTNDTSCTKHKQDRFQGIAITEVANVEEKCFIELRRKLKAYIMSRFYNMVVVTKFNMPSCKI